MVVQFTRCRSGAFHRHHRRLVHREPANAPPTIENQTRKSTIAWQSGRLRRLAIYRLLEEFAFGPDAIKAMTTAYHAALKTLRVADSASPMAELLAKNIVDVARRGERDPIRLHEKALGPDIG